MGCHALGGKEATASVKCAVRRRKARQFVRGKKKYHKLRRYEFRVACPYLSPLPCVSTAATTPASGCSNGSFRAEADGSERPHCARGRIARGRRRKRRREEGRARTHSRRSPLSSVTWGSTAVALSPQVCLLYGRAERGKCEKHMAAVGTARRGRHAASLAPPIARYGPYFLCRGGGGGRIRLSPL